MGKARAFTKRDGKAPNPGGSNQGQGASQTQKKKKFVGPAKPMTHKTKYSVKASPPL